MTGTIPAMQKLRSAVIGLFTLFVAGAAVAQTFPTVPGRTVIGRLGVAGSSGPSQAIPFATLKAQLVIGARSVVDEGAVGDNVADDATAINTAITKAFAAGGGNVYFPHPSVCYKINSPIVMKDGVSLFGDGGTASCINANNVNAITYSYTTGFGNSTIDSLYITGTNASTIRYGILGAGTTSTADVIYGVTISNTLISGFPVGISFRTVRNIAINNSWIQNVDKGIQFVGQAINVSINDTKVVKAAGGGGFAGSAGLELDNYAYVTGGTVGPEAVTTSAGTKFFGFDTCVLLTAATFVTIDQTDIGGCANVGIQFASVNNGLQITSSYIEVVGTAVTQGIYGVGVGSALPTQVNIADNTVIGSGTTSANGIQINGAANQNQNNVNIVRNYISGMTNNDIRANNPGQMNIANNRCASSPPTNSISVGTRAAGTITVKENNCDKAIAYVTAADLTSGFIRRENNISSGSPETSNWNITTDNTTAKRLMIGGGTGVQPTALAAGTNGQVVVGVTGADPAFATMSGDATIANTGALTLASTITAGGPTGSATVAPIITYDAKGRLTAVSSATITPAVGSITGLGTGVATALAVNVGSAGAFVTFNGALGSPSSIGTLPAFTFASSATVTGLWDVIGTSAGALRLTDVTTNATNKIGRWVGRQFTNSDTDFLLFDVRGLSGANEINLGGGSGVLNALTQLRIYTAANNTTLTGTSRFEINSSGVISMLAGVASTSTTTGTLVVTGGAGFSGDVWHGGNVAVGTAAKTLLLKQGANGAVGTFVCTSGGTITVSNSNIAVSDAIIISLNTVGGTVSTTPSVKTITAATQFQALCPTNDTSTYNYALIKNAA